MGKKDIYHLIRKSEKWTVTPAITKLSKKEVNTDVVYHK